MKYNLTSMTIIIYSLLLVACANKINDTKDTNKQSSNKTVIKVNPSLFLKDGLAEEISIVPCTLSDGSKTECYKIVSKNTPPDHNMGPWCPTNISDDASAGGIWMENGKVYDVDGDFIKNMASFYNDDNWQMYDADGNIFVTKTKEECAAAARPDVDEKYHNYCVECLPSYLTEITQTYLIPTTPIELKTVANFGRGGGGPGGRRPERGQRPEGGKPGKGERPNNKPPQDNLSVRGIAFNGVRFDAPAPVDAILGAYTLAPFDDAGGHINLNAGYHYHAYTGSTTKVKQTDNHAAMIGYALDGHAIYEFLDADGNEPEDLDECRGHYDEIRGYHYHVDKAGTNNFINCLHGAYAQ